MPFISQTAIGIREKLMVFGNDYTTKDGTPIRDYIHVEDLAEAHVIALKRLLNKSRNKAFEIFNLGTGIGYSVLDIINEFESITKTTLNYKIIDRRPGDVPELFTDVNVAKDELHWNAKRDLNTMISSA